MSLTCYITLVWTVAVSTVLASNISTLNHGNGYNLLVPEHVRDRMEPVKEPLNIVVILHMHGHLKKILLPAILFFGKIRRDFAEPLPDGAQLSRGPFTVMSVGRIPYPPPSPPPSLSLGLIRCPSYGRNPQTQDRTFTRFRAWTIHMNMN